MQKGTCSTKSDPHIQDVLADHPFGNTHSKQMVWFGAALGAPDQLRQRVAWAIAQILVVGVHLTGRENEVWHNFYDIFVRHAFGNYRDVLREVSYSPLMADYLTFLGNKALSYQKEVLGTEAFPDENFAREIMQLFTIGLFALRADGTRELDASGAPVAAYGNDEIMTFARAWTGFERNDARAELEHAVGTGQAVDTGWEVKRARRVQGVWPRVEATHPNHEQVRERRRAVARR